MTKEIRVVVADDHPVVRKGLCAMIEEEEDLRVVGDAGDGQSALTLISRLRPHVAVLDIDMPKLDGFGVLREMQKLHLAIGVIFLTLHAEEDIFRAALEMGGRGYLLKDSAMQEISVGIRAVAAGQVYLSSAMAGHLLRKPQPARPEAKSSITANLTPAERRILQLIAQGKSSKEIGADVSIHYRTVENHRTNICRKLDLEGANALLRFALQHKSEL